MKSAFAAAISTLILSGSALAAAVPFSDSFEAPVTTPIPGAAEVFQDDVGDNGDWNTIAGSGIEIQTAATLGITPFDGNQYVELDSFDNSTMAALIDFIAGQSYEIAFYFRPRTSTPDDNIIALSVGVYDETAGAFDGATQLVLANDVTSSATGGDWLRYSVIYAATAGVNGIALAALPSPGGNRLGGFIDLVSIRQVPAEVPLPGAFPLFLFGAAGLGAFRVRRRQS